MAVLLESPWYREILQKGENIGEKRGEKRGLLVGIAVGLELRFGDEGLALLPEIEGIDELAVLEAVVAAIKSVGSLDELRQVYLP